MAELPYAPALQQLDQSQVALLWPRVRVQQAAVGPEVALPVAEVPPADRSEVGLGIDQRVDRLGPVGLRRFAPRPVPAGGGGGGAHAVLVQPVDGRAGDLADVARFVEDREPVE